jgi:hypothetical protein
METAALILLLAGILLGISFTLACLIAIVVKVFKDT